MDKNQSLLIIKSVLDLAVQKGCFENLQAANIAATAYSVLAKEINPVLKQVSENPENKDNRQNFSEVQ